MQDRELRQFVNAVSGNSHCTGLGAQARTLAGRTAAHVHVAPQVLADGVALRIAIAPVQVADDTRPGAGEGEAPAPSEPEHHLAIAGAAEDLVPDPDGEPLPGSVQVEAEVCRE